MNLMRQARAFPTLAEPAFDRLIERFLNAPEWPVEPLASAKWMPAVDLTETAAEYVLKMDAPGFHKENLDINLDGNVLTVSGRRETKKDEETKEYIWRERQEGKFVRSIRLPEQIEAGKIAATYQDGILTVKAPKANPAVASRIPIK